MTQQSPGILFSTSTADPICWRRFFPFSLSNCLRALSVGVGFACSAGWYWFPALHNRELWSLLETRQVPLNTGLFGDFASIGWFTILMLVFLGLAIDNLFLSLQLRRSGSLRNPELIRHCAFSGPVLFSPVINERIHLVLPALIVQSVGVLLLLIVEWYGSGALYSLVPWILGTISALFGLLWFSLMTSLPGVWCCIAYALAASLGFGLSALLGLQSADNLFFLRVLLPALGLPLLFVAMPSSRDIKEQLIIYRRRHLHRARPRRCFSLWRLLRPASSFGASSRTSMLGAVIYLFVLLYGGQFLLEFVFGGFVTSVAALSDKYLYPGRSIALLGQACGAVIAMGLILLFPKYVLFAPLLGMVLFGSGTLCIPLSGEAPYSVIALYVATGCCIAFGLFIMQHLLYGEARKFHILGWGLALSITWSLIGGYLFWFLANSFGEAGAHQDLYMQFLALITVFCLLSFYWIWKNYQLLFTASEPVEERSKPELELKEPLTAREREVASMVQAGIKNIEISEMLHISDATLRVHLRRIYRKLGIQGRAKLKAMPRFHR